MGELRELLVAISLVSLLIASAALFYSDMNSHYSAYSYNDTLNTSSSLTKLDELAGNIKNSTQTNEGTEVDGIPFMITTGAFTALNTLYSSADILYDLIDSTIYSITGFPQDVRLILYAVISIYISMLVLSAILKWDL